MTQDQAQANEDARIQGLRKSQDELTAPNGKHWERIHVKRSALFLRMTTDELRVQS